MLVKNKATAHVLAKIVLYPNWAVVLFRDHLRIRMTYPPPLLRTRAKNMSASSFLNPAALCTQIVATMPMKEHSWLSRIRGGDFFSTSALEKSQKQESPNIETRSFHLHYRRPVLPVTGAILCISIRTSRPTNVFRRLNVLVRSSIHTRMNIVTEASIVTPL